MGRFLFVMLIIFTAIFCIYVIRIIFEVKDDKIGFGFSNKKNNRKSFEDDIEAVAKRLKENK